MSARELLLTFLAVSGALLWLFLFLLVIVPFGLDAALRAAAAWLNRRAANPHQGEAG